MLFLGMDNVSRGEVFDNFDYFAQTNVGRVSLFERLSVEHFLIYAYGIENGFIGGSFCPQPLSVLNLPILPTSSRQKAELPHPQFVPTLTKSTPICTESTPIHSELLYPPAASEGSTFRRCCNPFLVGRKLSSFFDRKFPDLLSDYRNFYFNRESIGGLFIALGGAAVLANTSLDQDFENWFGRNIRQPNSDNHSLNKFNEFTKTFGETPVILFFALSTIGYKLLPNLSIYSESGFAQKSLFGEYVTRVSRGYLIGTPLNLVGQAFIGAGRPSSGTSAWFKGSFNGVSGHAFVGAVPFITAAQMTDNFWLKCVLYTCSTFTGISRIYDNAHYLSQALLGWYLAYLASCAVAKTERKKFQQNFRLFPIIDNDSAGIGIIAKF
jgi:membrane-associated phospholipid phosphatase